MKRNFLYIIILFLAISCKNQESRNQPDEGPATVVFTVNLPEPVTVNTRAPYTDTDINNVDLLIFDQDGLFIERVKVDDITGSGSVKNFTARLDISNHARRIHIVANGRDVDNTTDRVNFSDITIGMAENVAIPLLKTFTLSPSSPNSILPLIMWGRTDVSSVTSSMNVSGFKLMRSQACIQIQTAAADPSNGLSLFLLNSFSISEAAAFGKVAPGDISSSGVIPTSPTASGAAHMNYFTLAGGVWNTSFPSTLYTYERTSSLSDYPSIIVSGTYNGQQGFYKVVMVDDSGVPLDIVRNHRYIITIVKAYGAGFTSVQEALDNAPSNALKVEILDSLEEITIIVADGKDELGISNNETILTGDPSNTRQEIAKIYTTHASNALSISSTTSGITSLNLIGTSTPGLYYLTGLWSGTGSGVIIVNSRSLRQTINVQIIPSFSTGILGEDADSYVYQLMNSTKKPWSVKIGSGSSGIFLDASKKNATDYSGQSPWGVSTLESRMAENAYLHVQKSGKMWGVITASSVDASHNLHVARMIYNRN